MEEVYHEATTMYSTDIRSHNQKVSMNAGVLSVQLIYTLILCWRHVVGPSNPMTTALGLANQLYCTCNFVL